MLNLELIFILFIINKQDIFSNNDRGNLLNDAFLLPYGGDGGVTYDQTLTLVRELFANPAENYIPWSVFVWYWNNLMGIEEHSKYFWNFKVIERVDAFQTV